MKFSSINELGDFQFHGAVIADIMLQDSEMVWHISAINTTSQDKQNDYATDMCIENATMIFENIQIESLIFSSYQVYDSTNTLIKDVEAKTISSEEYKEILITPNKNCFTIFAMSAFSKNEDENVYAARFNIDGEKGNFDLTFSFSKTIVEWKEHFGESGLERL